MSRVLKISLIATIMVLHAPSLRAAEQERPKTTYYDLRASLTSCPMVVRRENTGFHLRIRLTFFFYNRGNEAVIVDPSQYEMDANKIFEDSYPSYLHVDNEDMVSKAFAVAPGAAERKDFIYEFTRHFKSAEDRDIPNGEVGEDTMLLLFNVTGFDLSGEKIVNWPINKISYSKEENVYRSVNDCQATHRMYFTKGAPAEATSEPRAPDWELAEGQR